MLFFCLRFRYALICLLVIGFSSCRKTLPASQVDPDSIIETEPATVIPVTLPIDSLIGGYYVGLPVHYSETTKNYPAIIFLHGLGQMGNGSDELQYIVNDGIGKILKDKKLPPNFKVGRENLSFVVFSPQTSAPPAIADIGAFFEYVTKTYRVDRRRIYLSGLSLGSRVATLVAARFPKVFAALVPISGVAINPGIEERCASIGEANLPVWLFHNLEDPLSNIDDARQFVGAINSFNPSIAAQMTVFPVFGHDAWTKALDPAYRENGMNIYEWMLQFAR